MKEDKFDIGGLYKESFKNQKVEPPEFSWYHIDAKVSKMNFFRFNPMSFNIYYGVLIASTFLISAGIGVDYFILSDNQTAEPAKIEMIESNKTEEINAVDFKNTAKQPENRVKQKAKVTNQAVGKIPSKSTQQKNTDTELKDQPDIQQPTVSFDSTVKGTLNNTKTEPAKSTNEEDNEPVIIKEDNVIIKDTVTLKEQRPFWKRN